MSYDAAGNLVWSAAGQDLPSVTDCNSNKVQPAAVVARTYDVRNRLTTLSFSDGRGNQSWQYWPDGQPKLVTTYNAPGNGEPVENAYSYNKRRLLQGETATQPGWYNWSIGYGFDGNGHLASQTYPTGLAVTYAPNALGQATAVTSPGQNYATGVSYYSNGAIKQFTYGNGIVHTMVQNTRQLPDTRCDFALSCNSAAVLNDGYDYDANGNVASISDGLPLHRGNRTMTYDGLDRLKTTASPMFTQASYEYDILDNLTRANIAGGTSQRDHYYCYDAHQWLTNVKVGSCNGMTVIGLGYDARGNLANKNGQAFKFDYGNRLRDVPGKESYRYDALGRRVESLKVNQDKRLWQYSRSGQLMFGWTSLNNPVTEATQEYIYLAGSLVATVDHQWPSNLITALRYVHTDSLGSPIAGLAKLGDLHLWTLGSAVECSSERCRSISGRQCQMHFDMHAVGQAQVGDDHAHRSLEGDKRRGDDFRWRDSDAGPVGVGLQRQEQETAGHLCSWMGFQDQDIRQRSSSARRNRDFRQGRRLNTGAACHGIGRRRDPPARPERVGR